MKNIYISILIFLLSPSIYSQVSIEEIISMKKAGYNEDKILERVEEQGVFFINSRIILFLRKVGFSEDFVKKLCLKDRVKNKISFDETLSLCNQLVSSELKIIAFEKFVENLKKCKACNKKEGEEIKKAEIYMEILKLDILNKAMVYYKEEDYSKTLDCLEKLKLSIFPYYDLVKIIDEQFKKEHGIDLATLARRARMTCAVCNNKRMVPRLFQSGPQGKIRIYVLPGKLTWVTCPRCKGERWVVCECRYSRYKKNCPYCNNTGIISCPRCFSSVNKTEWASCMNCKKRRNSSKYKDLVNFFDFLGTHHSRGVSLNIPINLKDRVIGVLSFNLFRNTVSPGMTGDFVLTTEPASEGATIPFNLVGNYYSVYFPSILSHRLFVFFEFYPFKRIVEPTLEKEK